MKIAGIICEYNPFHNGHQFHIEQTRKMTGCDGVIAVMSGNFVQRGEPAIFDKQTRAAVAIAGGADLVLELPAMFAVQSAEFFAKHAVGLLKATGVVDYLSFGTETADLTTLQRIADVCAEEAPEYQNALKEALAVGKSFPRARGSAIKKVLGGIAADIAACPNNLLAIEYLKALGQDSGIKPVPVLREKVEHDAVMANGNFASATLIRQILCGEERQKVASLLPVYAYEKFWGCAPKRLESYTQAILTQFCKYSIEKLRDLPTVSEGLEFKIYRAARECDSLAEFLEQIKSKRYPLSRLRRLLIYALLDIRREDQQRQPLYLKVLDFNETGQKILHEMKKYASLPIVKHTGHVRRLRDDEIMELWERELVFDRIYRL